MSIRRFVILLALWGIVLLLAASPVGAILGFFVGITIAFFVAPLIFLLHVPETMIPTIGWTLLGVYGALILFLLLRGVLIWLRGDHAEARLVWFWAISLAAIAMTLKLSSDSLVAAWP